MSLSQDTWRNQTLIWEEMAHPFDEFGLVVDYKPTDDDPLYATRLFIWREQNLDTLTNSIIDIVSNSADFIDSPEFLAGATVAILAVSHFPLQIAVIEDDEYAQQFLSMVQKIRGVHFILKEDVKKYPELNPLMKYFIEIGILQEEDEQYVFAGKVLNRAHIKNIS